MSARIVATKFPNAILDAVRCWLGVQGCSGRCRISTSVIAQEHSNRKSLSKKTHTVHVLPAGESSYMYLLVDHAERLAAVVDPIEPETVMTTVERARVSLTCVLTTHHLPKCSGGNKLMADMFKSIPIFGGDKRVAGVTNVVGKGEIIKVGQTRVKCKWDPHKLSGHIAYYVAGSGKDDHPSCFLGHAMYVGGMGAFSESKDEHVFKAIYDVLCKMPDSTHLFTGCECAMHNLQFSLEIEPNNEDVKHKIGWVKVQRGSNHPTVPSKIVNETKFNPFLRAHMPAVQQFCGTKTAEETFIALRKLQREKFPQLVADDKKKNNNNKSTTKK